MLVSKLTTNNIDYDIVKYLISESIKRYGILTTIDACEKKNVNDVISFLLDDMYEFDCIAQYANSMIKLNIDREKWNDIFKIVVCYNAYIINCEAIHKTFQCLKKHYPKGSSEHTFLTHVYISFAKNSAITKNKSLYSELHNNIHRLETQLISDCDKMKLSDENITNAAQLFIHRHTKSNMLGYDNYMKLCTDFDKSMWDNDIWVHASVRDDKFKTELEQLKKMAGEPLTSQNIDFHFAKMREIIINDNCVHFDVISIVNNMVRYLSELYQFTTMPGKLQIRHSDIMVDLFHENKMVGTIAFDIYAREGKCPGVYSMCVCGRCRYPYENTHSPALIIIGMDCKRHDNILPIEYIPKLANELGKAIFHALNACELCILSGTYASKFAIETFGKVTEKFVYDHEGIDEITQHKLSVDAINKLIDIKMHNMGYTYKKKFLVCAYGIYVHYQDDFIKNCSILINCPDRKPLNDSLCKSFSQFYQIVFRNVRHDESTYLPLLWREIYDDSCSYYYDLLSDIFSSKITDKRECVNIKNIIKICNLCANSYSSSITENFDITDGDPAVKHQISKIMCN